MAGVVLVAVGDMRAGDFDGLAQGVAAVAGQVVVLILVAFELMRIN